MKILSLLRVTRSFAGIYLSLATCLWSLFIIASASFMRQLFNLLSPLTPNGVSGPLTVFAAIVVCILCGLVLRKWNIKPGIKQLLFIIAVLLLLAGYAYSLEIVEERIHILKYGFLGLLFSIDNSRRRALVTVGLATAFGLFIALLDEGFQYLLPYRVGDPRDVLIDTISAFMGSLLCRSLMREQENSQ